MIELTHQEVSISNVNQITALAHQLWPESTFEELLDDFSAMIGNKNNLVMLVILANEPVGFAHIALRNEYVEGAEQFPVAYLEGIYVVPNQQQKGIGEYMVRQAQSWAQAKGCTQLASDVEFLNIGSQAFHQKMGFEEVNRVVCYIKKLPSSIKA
ncbi:MAG TPA: GNAT family N-acetyltransferase [Microscillaceae bacterium]|nr:GNAT family N-acetyltransferase [Microscillaceae bacterium]